MRVDSDVAVAEVILEDLLPQSAGMFFSFNRRSSIEFLQ